MRVEIFIFFATACLCSAALAKPEPVCFNAGETTPVTKPNSPMTHTLMTKDKKYLITSQSEGPKFSVYDLKTGKSKEYTKPASSFISTLPSGEIAYQVTSGDSDFNSAKGIVDSLKRTTLVILDPATGKIREEKGSFVQRGSLYRAKAIVDENTLVVANEAGRQRTLYSYNMKNKFVLYGEDDKEPDVIVDETNQTVTFQDNRKTIFQRKLKRPGELASHMQASYAPDHKTFIVQRDSEQTSTKKSAGFGYGVGMGSYPQFGRKRELLIVDLNTKKERTLKLPDGTFLNMKSISPDSRLAVLNTMDFPNGGTSVIDLTTGKVQKINNEVAFQQEFNKQGEICYGPQYLAGATQGVRKCISPKDGHVISETFVPARKNSVVTEIDTNKFIVNNFSFENNTGQTLYYRAEKICPEPVRVAQCSPETLNKSELDSQRSAIQQMTLAAACAQPFDAGVWKNLPGPIGDGMSESAAVTLLKRFAKPGGFQPKEHLGALVGIINAGYSQKYPGEMLAGLNNILTTTPELYESLIDRFPNLKEIKGKPDGTCQTKDEQVAIQSKIVRYLKDRPLELQSATYNDVKPLLALARNNLTAEQKSTFADETADALTDAAASTNELGGIFPSKIHRLLENKIRGQVGLDYQDLSDVTLVREGNQLKYYKLGVNAFEPSAETSAGLFASVVKTIDVTKDFEKTSKETIQYEYGGKTFVADISLDKPTVGKTILPTGPSPNYDEMWKKKEFRGVVMAGSNMGSKVTDVIMREYAQYYIEQGFTFDKGKPIEDLKDYLKSRVSGPEPAHYFVKEAHSDGDEKNLFRLGKSGKILTGTRKVDGKTEYIELVYPDENQKTQLLPNKEFGEWMQDRDKKGGSELIYFNSSCTSVNKAVYEIPAAATPKLINIPSTSFMYMFNNKEDNAMRIAIDSVRNKKTYAEIRENLKKDKKYATNSGNVMIFPDQPEYKTKIADVLKVPVTIDVKMKVKSPSGQFIPYSIEDEQSHTKAQSK